MRLASNFLIGLGLVMLTGYYVIGWQTHSGFIHEPFVMLPAGTVFVRLRDDAMNGAHFHPGDLLIVDRSIKPTHGRMVVARVRGDLLLRRLVVKDHTGWLYPANPDYRPIELKDGLEYQILGVVRYRVHSV